MKHFTRAPRLLFFVLLTAAGLAGNVFHASMFFGADLVFGSTFTLLAAWLLGPLAGLASALIAHSYTVLLWHHPYIYLILCLEAPVVGWLRRYIRNLFLADALFWLLLGTPLVWVTGNIALEMAPTQALLILLKQPANGLFNALIAAILVNLIPFRRWLTLPRQIGEVSLRDLQFNVIMVFVFVSSLALTIGNGQQAFRDTMKEARLDLHTAGGTLQRRFLRWNTDGHDLLADYATHGPLPNGTTLPMDRRFIAVYKVDSSGMTNLAGDSPPGRQATACTGGLRSLDPGRYLQFLPLPGRCIVGVGDSAAIADFLERSMDMPGLRIALLDREGLLIASSQPDLVPGTPWEPPDKVERTALDGGNFQLLPRNNGEPEMTRWKRASYVREMPLANSGGWRLQVELPLDRYVDQLEHYYIRAFALVLAVIGLALPISAIVRGLLVGPLHRLSTVTATLPERIGDNTTVDWPVSHIGEVNAMTASVRRMADMLGAIFRESEERYKTLFDTANDAIILANLDTGRVINANRRAVRLTGRPRSELIGLPLEGLFPDGEMGGENGLLQRFAAGTPIAAIPLRFAAITGTIPVELTLMPVRTRQQLTAMALVRDIRAREQAHENLQLIAKVFENTTEGIVITDADTRIIRVNDAFTRITGYREGEVIGHTPALLHSGLQDNDFYREMWRELRLRGQWQGELWNRRRDGMPYAEWLSISALYDSEGKVSHYIGVFIDVTEQRRAQERIRNLAFYDVLTGLPNRTLFIDRLRHAVDSAHRNEERLALFFLDLDNFKAVNDTLGHHIGDLMLKTVAQRITSVLRESDTFARLGGDEFTVVLEEIEGESQLSTTAEKLLRTLSEPLQLEDVEVVGTASIGICLYPDNGESIEELMQHADTAMYRAKEMGRNGYAYFTEEMNARVVERMTLEAGLRNALRNGELELHFQPRVCLHEGHVHAAEALLRWNHPERGQIPPDRFIPVAEECGLINEIGSWVLHESCRHARAWLDAGLGPIRVAVNIADRQFRQPQLAETVQHALAESGLPPGLLELELTEHIVMDRPDALPCITRLKSLGIQLSIDDFGTGHSSLARLKRFDIDRLKIDRSFIRDIPNDVQGGEVTLAIIRMAQALHLQVTAEGVETEAQLAFVRHHHCEDFQGFLFSPGLPDEEFRALLVGGEEHLYCTEVLH